MPIGNGHPTTLVPLVLLDDAERVVSDTVGRVIESIQVIDRGLMIFKVLVQTNDHARFIVRFYPAGRDSVVDFDRTCGHVVVESDACPAVIADSRSGPEAHLAYVAYDMIEGERLSEALPHMGRCAR